MKKILLSLMVIGLTSVLAVGATTSYFSDTEISSGNTITAGTLDLKLDGADNPTSAKFNVTNAKAGTQINTGFILKNDGSITGNLSIPSIVVTNSENGITEPEASSGDATDTTGELADVMNLRIFMDYDKNGSIGTGETVVYNGLIKNLPTTLPSLGTLLAGSEVRVGFIMDWWNTASDNLAQGDSMQLNIQFMLQQ